MENKAKYTGKYKVNIASIPDTDGPDIELPKTLYYYCSLQTAMESILPKKRLLLSPLIKTNDPRVEKTEALTTLCRNVVTNVKPRALRHLDGQLKSAWRGPSIRFFHLPSEGGNCYCGNESLILVGIQPKLVIVE